MKKLAVCFTFLALTSVYCNLVRAQSIDTLTLTRGEVYDYNVGDEFHIKHIGHTNISYSQAFIKTTITSKIMSDNQDTVFYTYDNYEKWFVQGSFPPQEYEIEETHQVYYTNLTAPVFTQTDTVFYYSIDSLVYCEYITEHGIEDSLYNGRKFNSISKYCLEGLDSANGYQYMFIAGCGFIEVNSFDYYGGEYYDKFSTLFYYKKGGEEWGVPLFTGVGNVAQPPNASNFNVYLNEMQTSLMVECTEKGMGDNFLQLYNYNGQLILSEKLFDSKTVIDIRQFGNGIYICVLTDKYGIVTSDKLVFVR